MKALLDWTSWEIETPALLLLWLLDWTCWAMVVLQRCLTTALTWQMSGGSFLCLTGAELSNSQKSQGGSSWTFPVTFVTVLYLWEYMYLRIRHFFQKTTIVHSSSLSLSLTLPWPHSQGSALCHTSHQERLPDRLCLHLEHYIIVETLFNPFPACQTP